MEKLSKVKFLLPIWFALFVAMYILNSCHAEYDLEPRIYFEINVIETSTGTENTSVKVELSKFNTELLENIQVKNVTIGDFEIKNTEKIINKDENKIELNLSVPNNNFSQEAFIKVTAESPDKTFGTYYGN